MQVRNISLSFRSQSQSGDSSDSTTNQQILDLSPRRYGKSSNTNNTAISQKNNADLADEKLRNEVQIQRRYIEGFERYEKKRKIVAEHQKRYIAKLKERKAAERRNAKIWRNVFYTLGIGALSTLGIWSLGRYGPIHSKVKDRINNFMPELQNKDISGFRQFISNHSMDGPFGIAKITPEERIVGVPISYQELGETKYAYAISSGLHHDPAAILVHRINAKEIQLDEILTGGLGKFQDQSTMPSEEFGNKLHQELYEEILNNQNLKNNLLKWHQGKITQEKFMNSFESDILTRIFEGNIYLNSGESWSNLTPKEKNQKHTEINNMYAKIFGSIIKALEKPSEQEVTGQTMVPIVRMQAHNAGAEIHYLPVKSMNDIKRLSSIQVQISGTGNQSIYKTGGWKAWNEYLKGNGDIKYNHKRDLTVKASDLTPQRVERSYNPLSGDFFLWLMLFDMFGHRGPVTVNNTEVLGNLDIGGDIGGFIS